MGIPSEEFVTQTTQTIEVDGLPQGDAATWVLVLAWLRNAPERTGQSTVLHGTSCLGRGSGEHTVRFACARPNRRAPTGELTNPELSRKQLTFEVRHSGVQITNEGRRPLRVNGKPSQQAQLTHGDVIEVDRVLLAVLVRRAPWPAVEALEGFPFGERGHAC